MGRIKTTMIKRVGNKLVSKYRSSFKKTFEENKVIVPKFVEVPSKKLKNVLTGYITRLMNKEE
ncbi:MAG: 30S ribosomal protein S17e [bacterium]|nr:30S ribosomal protein S17e [bacterium]